MDTNRLKILMKHLEDARAELAMINETAAALRLAAGQNKVGISIDGHSIALTALDNRTWMPKQVRGMEMILLGAKKYFAALIEQQQDLIHRIEEAIRAESTGKS